MRRILIISQHFPPESSGNASRIYDMAINLSKYGLKVTVISPPPTFPTGCFERTWKLFNVKMVNGIENINLWTWQSRFRDPGFLDRILYYLIFPFNVLLWILLNPRRFDIILTSTPPLFTGIPGLLSKIVFKKPWILDVRDRWIDASISLGFLKKGCFYEKISRNFERLCYLNSDIIAVTTKELGRNISFIDGIEGKMILIPNGVDTDYFRPVATPRNNQIIYTGNIGHAQDLEKVILAFKQVIKKYDLKMLLVGDGDLRKDLEKKVQVEHLEDNITFTGALPREKIPKMLSESLFGLAPLKKMETLEYAVPTKAYEYMSCGIPFLGCGKGEIVDLANESGGGIIAENTIESIANAITKLVENPIMIENMGRKGRKFVIENYDRKEIANKLNQFIELVK